MMHRTVADQLDELCLPIRRSNVIFGGVRWVKACPHHELMEVTVPCAISKADASRRASWMYGMNVLWIHQTYRPLLETPITLSIAGAPRRMRPTVIGKVMWMT